MYGYGYRYTYGFKGSSGYETPLDIFGGTNMKQWINFNRSSIQSGGNITYASDLSGNGADLTQSQGANRPSANTLALNGKLTASFDGSTEYMICIKSAGYFDFLHDGTESTVFLVCKFGVIANPDALYTVIGDGGASSASVGIFISYDDRSLPGRNNMFSCTVSNGTTGNYSVIDRDNDSITPNTFHYTRNEIAAGNGVAANRSLRVVDGVSQTRTNVDTRAASAANSSYVMNYGRSEVAGGFGYLEGDIAEVIILNRYATAGEITRIETYFNNEWGL